MPEKISMSEQSPRENNSNGAAVNYHLPRLETFDIPHSQEERLEWVRKSCERFFEKIREIDALLGITELN